MDCLSPTVCLFYQTFQTDGESAHTCRLLILNQKQTTQNTNPAQKSLTSARKVVLSSFMLEHGIALGLTSFENLNLKLTKEKSILSLIISELLLTLVPHETVICQIGISIIIIIITIHSLG